MYFEIAMKVSGDVIRTTGAGDTMNGMRTKHSIYLKV